MAIDMSLIWGTIILINHLFSFIIYVVSITKTTTYFVKRFWKLQTFECGIMEK